MTKQWTVGSFFAGVGGICLGLTTAYNPNSKFVMSWANEIDPYACETYRHNFDHTLLEGDINMILDPKSSYNEERYQLLHEQMFEAPVDVLNGGFPCQSFSIAGEKKGFEDDRGNLFLAFIEYIRQSEEKFGLKPRLLFLENVKNLKSHDKGRTYRIIKEKLEECGYVIKEAVLNTMDFSDLPQNRERVYIIGFLEDELAGISDRFDMFDNLDNFKVHKKPEERVEDIKRIIDYSVDDPKYFYSRERYPHYYMSRHNLSQEGSKDKGAKNTLNLEDSVNEYYKFYQFIRRGGLHIRENKSNVCPTLMAHMGTGGNNVPIIFTPTGIRKLTPEETFKLQGFPIGEGYELPQECNGRRYGDSHLYKQAGNSVSVPVITMIAEQLLQALPYE